MDVNLFSIGSKYGMIKATLIKVKYGMVKRTADERGAKWK